MPDLCWFAEWYLTGLRENYAIWSSWKIWYTQFYEWFKPSSLKGKHQNNPLPMHPPSRFACPSSFCSKWKKNQPSSPPSLNTWNLFHLVRMSSPTKPSLHVNHFQHQQHQGFSDVKTGSYRERSGAAIYSFIWRGKFCRGRGDIVGGLGASRDVDIMLGQDT